MDGKHLVIFSILLLMGLLYFLTSGILGNEKTESNTLYRCPDCNVILIVIDALRADHLGCYGYERNTSPNIDKLANESILFERAYSQAPWTKPSVASLFTSLYVTQHRVIVGTGGKSLEGWNNTSNILDSSFFTLAEALSENSYYTIGVVNNVHLLNRFGFDQGFDIYLEDAGGPANLFRKFFYRLEFMRENKSRNKKFFAYVHSIGVHCPYVHPMSKDGECTVTHGNESLNVTHATTCRNYKKFNDYLATLDDEEKNNLDIECMVSAYDGGIRYNDEFIEELVNKLKREGLYNRTLLIITSDHGEQFLEHGRLDHGYSLHNELIHVPLIVHMPRGPSKLVKERVELIDIMPTIIDYLGIEVNTDYNLSGKSLIPLITGKGAFDKEFIVSECDYGGRRSIMNEKWKLIKNKNQFELYELEKDPMEKRNVSVDNPLIVGELEDRLLELDKKIINIQSRPDKVEIDEETIKKLESLGYYH
jgi:arylsulfatase A-like enzyme